MDTRHVVVGQQHDRVIVYKLYYNDVSKFTHNATGMTNAFCEGFFLKSTKCNFTLLEYNMKFKSNTL